ncbi:MAG: uroporphyrinogen decarboxylase family protein [Candidatus Aminicenantales bacterium]
MDSRRLVRKTLAFEDPVRIPRQKWILPWAELHYPEAVLELEERFPDDIVQAPAVYTRPVRTEGERYRKGIYVDEWGCRFTNPMDGIIGVVQEPLVSDWSDLERFSPPEATLNLDRVEVDTFCRQTDRFVLAGTLIRPFERYQFIRTMEQALVDLSQRPDGMFELLKRIHEHYLKEAEVWASTDVDAIALMDDWGTQQGLIASPEVFRELFLPMYREYAEVARHHGKAVFMHSDGYILDIIPDLIEAGVDALNSQVFCMGVRELGERFRGKLTFWGEIDRQNLLPHGSAEEIREAVLEMWLHLHDRGGVIAQCEFGLEADPRNVFAVFEAWDRLSRSRKEA